MSQYRFIATGNFVDFYDQDMHVIKLHNTSRCVTWLFDATPGLNFKIDEMIYHTDNVSDISFDDVACTTQADFITGITTMFPDLAGGGEGSGGIDEVLAEAQALTANRGIDLNGNVLNVVDGVRGLLSVSKQNSYVSAFNDTAGGNSALFDLDVGQTAVNMDIHANFNDGVKSARIQAFADATEATLTHTADKHKFVNVQEFADNAAALAGDLEVGMIYRTGDISKIVH